MRKIILLDNVQNKQFKDFLVFRIHEQFLIAVPITNDILQNYKNSDQLLRIVKKRMEKIENLKIFLAVDQKFNQVQSNQDWIQRLKNLCNKKDDVDVYKINMKTNYNLKTAFVYSGHFKIFFKKYQIDFIYMYNNIHECYKMITQTQYQNSVYKIAANCYFVWFQGAQKLVKIFFSKQVFIELHQELDVLKKNTLQEYKAVVFDMIIDLIITLILGFLLYKFYVQSFKILNIKKYFSEEQLQDKTFQYTALNILQNAQQTVIKLFRILTFLLCIINYRMVMSFYLDLLKIAINSYKYIVGKYQQCLSFVKMKMRDFYLIINDLGYSPKIKEIIFKNETVNKKTFIVTILNSVIILYCLMFIISLFLQTPLLLMIFLFKNVIKLKNFLRKINSKFMEHRFNWYLKVPQFKLKQRIQNVNIVEEIN